MRKPWPENKVLPQDIRVAEDQIPGENRSSRSWNFRLAFVAERPIKDPIVQPAAEGKETINGASAFPAAGIVWRDRRFSECGRRFRRFKCRCLFVEDDIALIGCRSLLLREKQGAQNNCEDNHDAESFHVAPPVQFHFAEIIPVDCLNVNGREIHAIYPFWTYDRKMEYNELDVKAK